MVSRKTSLPYPASPPAQDPSNNSFAHAPSHLNVDTSDVPPVPSPARDDSRQQQESSYMDNDNPWHDYRSPASQTVPDALRTGGGGHQREHSLTNIPQALRPGGSGQDTPRSSIDSGESRDWWDDDVDEDGNRSPRRSPTREIPDSLRPRGNSPSAPPQPPSPSTIKRKPVASANPGNNDATSEPHEFASNNPFRLPTDAPPPPPAPLAPPPPLAPAPVWGSEETEPEGKGKSPMRDPAFSASITDFSRMTVSTGQMPDPSAYLQSQTPQQEEEDPWKRFEAPPPPLPQAPPPPLPQAPPPAIPPPTLPTIHAPAISVSEDRQDHDQNPWASQQQLAPTPSPIPFDQSQKHDTQYNNHLLDRGEHNGTVPLKDELLDLPNASHDPRSNSEISLLEDDEGPSPQYPGASVQAGNHQPQPDHMYAPPPGPPPGRSSLGGGSSFQETTPPPKPPRPAIVTAQLSEAQLAKNAEYRNETYLIKHFNWFDHVSGRLRRSSMLTQNKNGPCPLLALVNALILGAKDESQAALDDALRSREQVSLGLIIETLMYELVDRSSMVGQQLPDVDELNAFLLRLRTGMNANPRFTPPPAAVPNLMDARHSMINLPQSERAQLKAGTFEATGDIKLYGAFSVPLVHGWIPESGSEAAHAFARSAPTYEDAQAIQFGEEELEYKLTRDGLSPDEQRVWEDITSIKNFFKLHPTQLTPTGLNDIQESLQSGSFAIMFRNDHFSTVYKHPQSGQLFILVTDQGYADRDEIIWESLVDISGKANEFFSGDFMPVSHQQNGGSSSVSAPHLTVDQGENAPLSPQQQQEQHDADFAMALQMQEEEEQRQRAEQARRRRSGQGQGPGQGPGPGAAPSHSPRASNGNIPITLTRSRQSQSDAPENRPAIPPRNQRPGPPAVNRPTDTNDEDAPPAYEEAAKGKPYIPPVGSPLHPSSGPANDNSISPMSSNTQLTGTISAGGSSSNVHPPGPNAPYYGSSGRPAQNRIPSNVSGRTSAYNEQQSTPTQQMPGAYWDGRRPGGAPSQGMPVSMSGRRHPGQERDCVVM